MIPQLSDFPFRGIDVKAFWWCYQNCHWTVNVEHVTLSFCGKHMLDTFRYIAMSLVPRYWGNTHQRIESQLTMWNTCL